MTTDAGRPLYAFFDMSVSPIGYDFITFLVMAEVARRESDADSLRLVMVLTDGGGFRDDPRQDRNIDVDQKHWRIMNLALPACSLMPSCNSMHVCADRNEARQICADIERRSLPRYPADYTVDAPTTGWEASLPIRDSLLGSEMPTLRAPTQAVSYVSTWMETRALGQKVVSITLREAEWHDDRNSNIREWALFATWLIGEGYLPVFLRDTSKIFDGHPDAITPFQTFDPGPVNIPIRMAFYEACYLNLFVSNGPAELAMFNGAVRYVLYKAASESGYKKNPHPHGIMGLYTHDQLPYGTPYHRWIWENDELPVLQREFIAMAQSIEASGGRAFERLTLKRSITRDQQLKAAHIYRFNGRMNDARMLYQPFRDSLGERIDYWLWLAHVEAGAGNHGLSREYMERVLAWPGVTPIHLQTAGDIAIVSKDPAQAEIYYRRMLDGQPATPQAHMLIGMCDQLQGRNQAAFERFRQALDLDPDNTFIREKLAEAAKETGQLSLAIDLWIGARAKS